jgi:hypothetical protein
MKKADRKRLSFAEAEGRPRFSGVLEWGALDQRLRAALWNVFCLFFDAHIRREGLAESARYLSPLKDILLRDHLERRHGFLNDFSIYFHHKAHCVAEWAGFFRSADYVELFDFVTFFLRDSGCPKDLVRAVAAALNVPWSPYRLILKPPTVYPAVSEQQAEIVRKDVDEVFDSRFEGSKTHLQAALDSLNKGSHRDCVRESINAVESAVRDFTENPNALLSQALKKLASQGGMHKSLSDAFEKLYAYTSDEKGIRHSLVFADNEKVGFDEALFFVSACSAFIAFLSHKSGSKKL